MMEEDGGAKMMMSRRPACSGGESSIMAHWLGRRQACEQMDLDRRDRESELIALARLHAVSSMLDASFLHSSSGGGSRRRARSPERALVRRIAREWEGMGMGMAATTGTDHHGRRMAMERQRELQSLSDHRAVSAFAHRARIQVVSHTEDDTHDHEILESTAPDGNHALQNDFPQEHIHHYEEYSDSRSEEVETDDSVFLHREEEWHVIESREEDPQWQLGPSFNPTGNRFSPPDDDVYGVELRELLSRRSVSNLLSSGFRESLDQLIRSYVQRQEHDWDFQGQRPSTGSGLLNEIRIDQATRAESDTAPQPSNVLSDQALSPQQRQWQQIESGHRHNWSQQSMHRSEFDWDAIHVLRDELSGVQRGMSSMQQMLEACMEMQIELQRSIKQEVSAALNLITGEETSRDGEDGSQWKLARKGTCCICCDNQIDSLLYRCGHMCTCSKCAGELLHGVGKCPLCRAPIVEVVRAYCIM
ncbi:unnamed protein product [Urochloa decumbens]|uniref:RING-type domain-containing protein n=1 Tax=Urochloa decumbens TaxID=240449 RepID=A0ABC8WML5_9POAL